MIVEKLMVINLESIKINFVFFTSKELLILN